MTQVTFMCKHGQTVLFETSGHSGYAQEGSDIVCAAVSSTTELAIGILEKFAVEFHLKIDRKSTSVRCEIVQSQSKEKLALAKNVLDGYFDYLQSVAKAYPANLKCIKTETAF